MLFTRNILYRLSVY